MINKDLENIISLIKKNSLLLLVLLGLFLIINNMFDSKSILIIILLLILFYFYNQSNQIHLDNHSNHTNQTSLNINNTKIKTNIAFDDETTSIINELKPYKKYNKKCYKKGIQYLKMFYFLIQELENNDIDHYQDKYENAGFYLKTSLNEFQSLTISVPEESYLNSIKFKKYEINHNENIGNLCKKLHNHCYHLLFNLSLELNKKYTKDPKNYNSLIINDNIMQSNFYHSLEMY